MSEMDIPTSDGVVPDGYEETPLTPKPAKSKKRSRHSEPMPARSPNTGLTPALKRSRMQTPAGAQKKPKSNPRRQTMPAAINHNAVVLPPEDEAVEMQFVPIRQVLSPRTRRRIKRMGLSEAQNTQHEQNRLFDKQAERIEQLEAELAATKEEIQQALKAQRPSASFQRAQEIQAELQIAQEELAAQSPDPATTLPPYQSGDDIDDVMGSPARTEPFSDNVYETTFHGDAPQLPGPHNDNHVGVQTEPVSPSVRSSASRVATRNSFLVRARMELEYITPGETALPLQPSKEGGAGPLITALLDHLRKAKLKLAAKDSSLQNIMDQEQNLRRQFDTALTNTGDARARVQYLEKKLYELNEWFKASRRQANDYYNQFKNVRADLAVSKEELAQAQKEAEENRDGTERLSGLLLDLQRDLNNYQNMIFDLEETQRIEIEKLNNEHLKAINDLEAQVEEEMHAREQAISDANIATKAINRHRNELQETVHEKQHHIRKVQERLEKEQQGHQQLIGNLNVRIANSVSKMHEAEEQIKIDQSRARASVKSFVDKVRQAGEEALAEIGGEDATTNPSGGLITPDTDAGHLPNPMSDHVVGHVEMRRGKAAKKRRPHPDSGIGILEEDDEDGVTDVVSGF